MEPSPPPPPSPNTAAIRPPVLEMIGVTVPSLHTAAQVIVENVDWSVAPGDFWAIGGLQNSGKSDFLAVAAGVLPPTRGTLKVFGNELRAGFEAERMAIRRRIGVVFHGGHLLQHLSVADNITLPIRYHRNCRTRDCAERLQMLLDLTELQASAEAHPGQLPLGRRQRAGLARALALQPELLLLDNPLSGLDPQNAAWFLDLLEHLASGHPVLDDQPLTLVVTTDDFRPWHGRARQFAALRRRCLVRLGHGAPPDPETINHELQEDRPVPCLSKT
jgi:phospholipid/cholesterol/gamma-HCH transport system ATP-binding protein